MAISKFTPQSAKKDTGRTIGDNEVAKLAHLNRMVDQVNNEFANFNPGGGESFTVVTTGTLGTSTIKWDWKSLVFVSPEAGTKVLTPTSYPSIQIGSMGYSGTLQTISISDLTFLEFTVNNVSTLTSVSFPDLTTILAGQMGNPTISVQGNSSLTTLNIPSLSYVADSLYISWTGTAFSQATVDHILVKFAGTTAVNGNLQLNGGTAAVPSATGLAAKAVLEGRGWNVYTN
jgi:hypothetical protein